jgi:hypothetical protein
MEKAADLLENMKLSDQERKGVRIGWTDGRKMGVIEPQAITKLMSDKPAFAEAMEEALGRIWCPLKGLRCKDLGENIFLCTFHQESGKRKALNDGPWMFSKSLLVVEDFVLSKTLNQYAFQSVPIWIRIFLLPLGDMNRAT